MTIIGKCTKCRGPRTVLRECKVEAFAGDPRPVLARLCDACVDGIARAVVTPMAVEVDTSELTVVDA